MAVTFVLQDNDAYQQLIEQVIAGNGLPAVARLLSDMLALPATVADEEFEPLHAFAPRGRHLSREEAALAPSVRSAIFFDLAREPQASTAPPVMRLQGENGHEHAVSPIVLPSGIVGYIWVTDPSGQLSPRADTVVSHAAAACAVEMVRQRALMEGEARVRNSFLEDLLTGSITSVTGARRRARFLGYELRGEQVVFMLDIDQFVSFVSRRGMDEPGIQRLKERFRRSVDACIPAIWSRTMIWEHSDSIVVLAPSGKDIAAVRNRVEVLRAQVERRLAGPTISAGIGRAYGDLTKLQHSYREAEHSLRIGTAISGPSSSATFEDLGAYRLLFHLRDQPELQSFCEETLGALAQYDEEHDSHLLETLSCFLDMQGNLSQTARALHLHRNGLLYRLSRIKQIAECDLDNPSQRLALQIALLARPLLQQKRHGQVSIRDRSR